jgi:hypothetical protein
MSLLNVITFFEKRKHLEFASLLRSITYSSTVYTLLGL